MREKLMAILEELRPDVDFENEKQLITDGILESFDIVALVGEISDASTSSFTLRISYPRISIP